MERVSAPDRGREERALPGPVPAIAARDLVKTYAGAPVLRGVSVTVALGERLVILGGNGAGKTTLLQVLATAKEPTAGTVRLLGLDVRENQAVLRSVVGFVGHRGFLYPDLTSRENLRLYASLYGVPDAAARVEALLGRVGLWRQRDQRVRTFSRGMAQRAELARALVHDPALLFLDEPDTGLDAPGLALLEEIVRDGRIDGAPRTIVLTTHRASWGRAVASRVGRVERGRLVDDSAGACA